MLRHKAAQLSISLKLALTLFFLFFVFLIIRSNLSFTQEISSQAQKYLSNTTTTTTPTPTSTHNPCPSPEKQSQKAPPSLANALVHYATTNITPQQTLEEISVSLRVLEKKSPCNFLIFGLGHDSLLWASLNHGGRTVFLEEDKSWIAQLTAKFPSLEAHHVTYDTSVREASELMIMGRSEACRAITDPRQSGCRLALKGLPAQIYDEEWDAIMVDAPTGYHDAAPGRMAAIYTAGLMARNRESGDTDVFVHDVDRPVEDSFSKAFLCEGYMVEQENRLRHFLVPSHMPRPERPFCP